MLAMVACNWTSCCDSLLWGGPARAGRQYLHHGYDSLTYTARHESHYCICVYSLLKLCAYRDDYLQLMTTPGVMMAAAGVSTVPW